MTIFDTHAHYDSRQFEEDMDAVLLELSNGDGSRNITDPAPASEVKVGRIINSGADIRSSYKAVELAEKYGFIYASVGVHPDSAGEIAFCEKRILESSGDTDREEPEFIPKEQCQKNWEELEELCKKPRAVAIGEIGLDYHWDVWPRETQKEAFRKQWDLALSKDLPIIIHSRDAAEDTLNIVKEYYEKGGRKPLRADMHCYSYSPEHAEEYLKMGLMFGIGGVLTFKNAKKLKEVVDLLPLERILLETDAPYMAPDPFRGKRNDSGMLTFVAEKLAEIKGVPVDKVYEQTFDNAARFFRLTPHQT